MLVGIVVGFECEVVMVNHKIFPLFSQHVFSQCAAYSSCGIRCWYFRAVNSYERIDSAPRLLQALGRFSWVAVSALCLTRRNISYALTHWFYTSSTFTHHPICFQESCHDVI